MCGICGYYSFEQDARSKEAVLRNAIEALSLRGPDGNGSFVENAAALGHARLAIIDVSENANQPLFDASKRYVIVFNGEIYNYKELKEELLLKGYLFSTKSDTEVLLNAYIEFGTACLEKLNGFFGFAIYDRQKRTLFVARDRFGIKPLLFAQTDKGIAFASEMKALIEFGIDKTIDFESLSYFFRLNYIPAPHTVFKSVQRLMPGQFFTADEKGVKLETYYDLRERQNKIDIPYQDAMTQLETMLDESVQKRLVSDVPLGCFLSGGVDSSVISILAAKHKKHLHTFSIGYKDEPYFDETEYARAVADKIGTEHTVFSLSNDDLFDNLFSALDYIDEPFADSSALAVNILSMHTRKHVTVSLSGDGADEMFAGYHKHGAHFKALENSFAKSAVIAGAPLWKRLPKSRNSKMGNVIRQLDRFSEAAQLDDASRYLRWCSFAADGYPDSLLQKNTDEHEVAERRVQILKAFESGGSMNEVLLSDMSLVLPNDMLTKVDLMSMANSLEVRTPFLDHELVEFVFSLPDSYKITSQMKKRVLQDTFRKDLPELIYKRPKHGFEVPLLKWFRNELKPMIVDDLLADRFVSEQGIFKPGMITRLKHQLFSNDPGEVHAQIWALIVFQYWWKKYI